MLDRRRSARSSAHAAWCVHRGPVRATRHSWWGQDFCGRGGDARDIPRLPFGLSQTHWDGEYRLYAQKMEVFMTSNAVIKAIAAAHLVHKH